MALRSAPTPDVLLPRASAAGGGSGADASAPGPAFAHVWSFTAWVYPACACASGEEAVIACKVPPAAPPPLAARSGAAAGFAAVEGGWILSAAGPSGRLRLRWLDASAGGGDCEPAVLETAVGLRAGAWALVEAQVTRGGGRGGVCAARLAIEGCPTAFAEARVQGRADNAFALAVGAAPPPGLGAARWGLRDFYGLIAGAAFERGAPPRDLRRARPRLPADAPAPPRVPRASPFRSFRDLLEWACGGGAVDALMRCWVPWAPRSAADAAAAAAGRPPAVRSLVCHDAGACVYVEDATLAGPSPEGHVYRLGHWAFVDALV